MWRHLVVCVAMVSMAVASSERWETYKNSFGLSFEDAKEEATTMTTFLENVKAIEKHNFEADLGKHSYWQGVNQFTHMTDEEYRADVIGNCLLDSNGTKSTTGHVHKYNPNLAVPGYVNFVEQGYVTPVKTQGKCGSCYAFSATGALEGQWFKKTGKLVSLSEQQIVDCSGTIRNKGCQGGWYENAWQYVHDVGGLEPEKAYPYKDKTGGCHSDPSEFIAKVRYFSMVQGNDEELKQVVFQVGPVSVSIDASLGTFRNYRTGVYYDPDCSTTKVNHAVLVVGYGNNGGELNLGYWLVKNSWGPRWGAGGYIKIGRSIGNNCGITRSPSYPTV